MIAALFVQRGGCYWNLEGVDPWDVERDARRYDGPYPVVAHPPCARWCRLAGLVEARYGYKRGDDDGCFQSALDNVRRWGGVLEHPAYSDAWSHFDLPKPNRHGGWQRGFCGGWACHVEQLRYGHAAKKATWLYAYGTELPALRWGSDPDIKSTALVSWCGNKTKATYSAIVGGVRHPGDTRPRMSKKTASATPVEFRDVLIGMARSARR